MHIGDSQGSWASVAGGQRGQ